MLVSCITAGGRPTPPAIASQIQGTRQPIVIYVLPCSRPVQYLRYLLQSLHLPLHWPPPRSWLPPRPWDGIAGTPTDSPSTNPTTAPTQPFFPGSDNMAGNTPSSTKAGICGTRLLIPSLLASTCGTQTESLSQRSTASPPPSTVKDSSRWPTGFMGRGSSSASTSSGEFPARSSRRIYPSPVPAFTRRTPPTPRLSAHGTRAIMA